MHGCARLQPCRSSVKSNAPVDPAVAIEYIKLVISFSNILLTVALFIYVRIDRNQRATAKSISHLEISMSRLPTREEMNREWDRFNEDAIRIHERVDEVNNAITEMQMKLGELYGLQKQRNRNG